MTSWTSSHIACLAAERAFGSRLVTNVTRGLVAETIVSTSICPEWTWCSADYFPFDFRHSSGARLEVKQSAARQSWPSKKASAAQWDIAERAGYWDGDTWFARPGRCADIYVLAWHPGWDGEVDHRDPLQWRFFVIATKNLPSTKRIGMAAVRSRAPEVEFGKLAEAVAGTLQNLQNRDVPHDAAHQAPEKS